MFVKSVIIRYHKNVRIYFSNQGNLRYFGHFVKKLDFSNTENLEIVTDERWVNVHPAYLTLAAALAKKVGKANAKIISSVPESGRYLDRMGLYNLIDTPSPFGEYRHKDPSGRFIPITFIKTSMDQSRFISDMVPLLHLEENDTSTIKYIVGELVRNVLEHSCSINGAVVSAQYFKNTNRISLAICDTGIGLWKGLRIWKPRTDEEAIRLALTPGISGTTRKEGGTSENAGAGLFFIKSIAKTTRSNFAIYSGKSAYILKKTRPDQKKPILKADPFEDACVRESGLAQFDGTLVAVDISLDATVEFRQMLDMIGSVYESAIQQRRKQRFKRPNFI